MSRSFALTAAALALPLALAACGNSSPDTEGQSSATSTSVSASSATSGAGQSSSTSSSTGTSTNSSGSTQSSGAASSTSAESTATPSSSSQPSTVGHVSVSPSTAQGKAPTPTQVKKSALENTPVSSVHVTTPDGGPQTGAAVATQSLVTSVNGRTLSYTYSASGKQHLYRSQLNNAVIAAPNSRGVTIDFGDGSGMDGADLGALQCAPKSPLAAFADKLPTQTHTYAAAGTYTVTTTTYFCGDSGPVSKSSTQKVTIN